MHRTSFNLKFPFTFQLRRFSPFLTLRTGKSSFFWGILPRNTLDSHKIYRRASPITTSIYQRVSPSCWKFTKPQTYGDRLLPMYMVKSIETWGIFSSQECAENLSFRVDKAWRQRCSQRFRNVLAAGPERRGQRLLGHLGVLKNKHSMMAQDGYKIDHFVVEPGLLWWYTHPLEIRANIAWITTRIKDSIYGLYGHSLDAKRQSWSERNVFLYFCGC